MTKGSDCDYSLTKGTQSTLLLTVCVNYVKTAEIVRRVRVLSEVNGIIVTTPNPWVDYQTPLSTSLAVTWWVSYKRQELLALCGCMGSPTVFGGVRVAHRSSFLCCVFQFVCLRPVSCVPNVCQFLKVDYS